MRKTSLKSRTKRRQRRTINLNPGAGPSDRPFESESLFSEAATRWNIHYFAEVIERMRPALSQQRVRQLAEEWAHVEPPCLALVLFNQSEREAMLAEGLSHFSIETLALVRLLGPTPQVLNRQFGCA